MSIEVVHVMLKPDTLEFGMRDVVVGELLKIGGELILTKRLTLDYRQITEIYPDFKNQRARDLVFRYFVSRETEHLVLIGETGIHQKYQAAKGKPGNGGIRGKFYTRYTKLTPMELQNWFDGTLPNIEDIDLEMFARDILHVPNSPEGSRRGLCAILDDNQIAQIVAHGVWQT